ncbi:hypothetical protein [Ferrimonas marina]|uniref:Uncharacterized protein n=1 Tax=Ferrimonas marina TaxID=299255 RepID=A0A1M5UAP4_9GAMM|nr:hypothetical protein [Ferrimonas marina]SHH59916.1 hypothetical protein SAMN02745129_2475 [Ferrimonas marina]
MEGRKVNKGQVGALQGIADAVSSRVEQTRYSIGAGQSGSGKGTIESLTNTKDILRWLSDSSEKLAKSEADLAEVLRTGDLVSGLSTVKISAEAGQSIDELMADPLVKEIHDLVKNTGKGSHGMQLVSERIFVEDGTVCCGYVLQGNLSQMRDFALFLNVVIAINSQQKSRERVTSTHLGGVAKVAEQASRCIPSPGDDDAKRAAQPVLSCYVDVTDEIPMGDVGTLVARSALERLVPLGNLPGMGKPATPTLPADGMEREVEAFCALAMRAKAREHKSGGLER